MDRRMSLGAMAGILVFFELLPLVAKAQLAAPVRRIGFLSPDVQPTPAEEPWAPWRERGWIEGHNLHVERRYANNRPDLLRALAEQLVRLRVEVIVTIGTNATTAAKNVTTTIPIVMLAVGDPVRAGLVASLARPGGNITGYTVVSPELDAKRLSLLHDLLPGAQRIAVLVNPTNPIFNIRREANEQVFRSMDMQPVFIEVASSDKLGEAVAEAVRRKARAIVVVADPLFYENRNLILRAAITYALPAVVEGRGMLMAGGVLSYAVSEQEQSRRVAALLDKILRGANPADIPIEQPTQFELGINLKTARELGITVPQSLLLAADVVIQ